MKLNSVHIKIENNEKIPNFEYKRKIFHL